MGNGKENKEGWNLRKVRMQMVLLSGKSSKSSKSLREPNTSVHSAERIASGEWLLASGSASPQTGKLPVEHTNLPLPPLLPPRPTSTVCVDSGKLPPNEQPNEINRRCIRKS